MTKVVGVRFREAGKIYYFDPGDLDVAAGDEVIVETARGIEYGTAAYGDRIVADNEVIAPLKPILRIANEEDRALHLANQEKREQALKLCQEKIEKHSLDMKLVDVEYTFDHSKIIFYFTSDGRVDFRELVKDLAGVFRMRIELRQIGVRDETKLLGGIGSCGRALCCHSWLADFEPVSIKMAKVQNLSLNPVKISGTCGRLMCCLQFENDVYTELKKGMPEPGDRISTQDGMALVCDVNVLENKIKTRLVLEERSGEQSEKLSTEYHVYAKEDIGKPAQKDRSGREEEKSGRSESEREKSRKRMRRPKQR